MNSTIARTEVDQCASPARADGHDAGAVERRAAVFARELGAVGDVGWLLARRAATLAGRMERLAERDEVIVAAGVDAAHAAFDAERRAERAGWAADLDGDDPGRIAEALASLELSGPGLDVLHRLWGRLLEGIRSDDPATVARASQPARKYLDATGTGSGTTGDPAALAARVAAEVARLRGRDERTRAALERMMADARREVGLAAAFDPSPEATVARRHEAAAERGFFRAVKLIRDLRRDAGLAPVAAEAEALPPAPAPAPRPAGRPARPSAPAAALGPFALGLGSPPPPPDPDPLASFCVGGGRDRRDRPDLARAGRSRR